MRKIVGFIKVLSIIGIVAASSFGETWNTGADENVGGEESVIATLDGGTLKISGTGAMRNFEGFGGNYSLWNSRKNDITTVIIEDGVTTIGNYAFLNCDKLTSITIPNSVTTIGDGAFSGCRGLTSITIPNSVTTIEVWAFEGCIGLTSITIPNSVTTIGNGAFLNCDKLTSITISNSVTTIGNVAFAGCSSLEYIISLNSTPPTIYSNTFDNTGDGRIYVVNKSAYENAPNWSGLSIRLDYLCALDDYAEHHDLQNHESKSATCTEDGWNAYQTCERNDCGHSTKEDIPALGHDETGTSVTCTADKICKIINCGHIITPKLNHDLENHESKEETCTAIGWNAYQTCERNGCGHSTKVDIPALGHDLPIAWTQTQASTCEADGKERKTCTKTDCGHFEEQNILALEHNFGEIWTITKSATVEEHGEESRTCERTACTETETRQTDKLPPATSIADTKKSNNREGIKLSKNPVSDNAQITIILPNNEKIAETKITIYDMTGNIVFVGAIAPNRPLIWNLTNTAGRNVANGTYLVIAEIVCANGQRYHYSAKLGVKR